MTCCGVKRSWPEVVGWTAGNAVVQIREDRPDVTIEIVQVGTDVEPGYNNLRVRVYVDCKNYPHCNVVYVPVIG